MAKSEKFSSKVPSLAELVAPWVAEDGTVDVEAAKKAIHTLMVDKAKAQDAREDALEATKEAQSQATELQEKLDDKSDPDAKAELEKARKRETEAGTKAAKAEARADRAELALEKGLTLNQAKRLVGENREELEADADELVKDLGLDKAKSNDGDEETGGRVLPSGDRLTNGGDPKVPADAEPDYELLAAGIGPQRTI